MRVIDRRGLGDGDRRIVEKNFLRVRKALAFQRDLRLGALLSGGRIDARERRRCCLCDRTYQKDGESDRRGGFSRGRTTVSAAEAAPTLKSKARSLGHVAASTVGGTILSAILIRSRIR